MNGTSVNNLSFSKIGLWLRTLSYLRFSQILARTLRKSRRFASQFLPYRRRFQQISTLSREEILPLRSDFRESYRGHSWLGEKTFIFLNQRLSINDSWFPDKASHLWIFKLHSFDFLFEIDEVSKFESLVEGWITEVPTLHSLAWHPYPLSHRVCSWIWNYSRFQQQVSRPFEKLFLDSLENQLRYLFNEFEFDLLGNHLLLNCKGLIIGGLFTRNVQYIDYALGVLKSQLHEQILKDGGHYERSPMYHTLVLQDLSEICNSLKCATYTLPEFLIQSVVSMCRFLQRICVNGKIPLLNDSCEETTPPIESLIRYIEPLFKNIENSADVLIASMEMNSWFIAQDFGLVKYCVPDFALVMDVGKIGPDFLPGHAHNDTLSYCLHFDGSEIVTDSGIYEYQEGRWRDYFRSSIAHNVVTIDGIEPNEIWKSFRVGFRGYPTNFECDPENGTLRCGHTSYKRLHINLERVIRLINPGSGITVLDLIDNQGKKKRNFENNIHFAPNVEFEAGTTEGIFKAYQLRYGSIQFALVIVQVFEDAVVEERQSWYSAQFGQKTERLNICIKGSASPGKTNCTYLLARSDLSELLAFARSNSLDAGDF